MNDLGKEKIESYVFSPRKLIFGDVYFYYEISCL